MEKVEVLEVPKKDKIKKNGGRGTLGCGDICKEKPAQYSVQVLLKYNHLHFCSYY